jgi:membrane protein implicated in regulation of membrane protease activity
MAAWVLWLIAAGLFVGGEMLTLDLVLLMFAGGALGGTAVALAGGAVAFQLIACSVDGLVGRTAVVTRAVDADGGRIRMGADEWTARTQHRGEAFGVGETVRILQIDGATAVVGDALE